MPNTQPPNLSDEALLDLTVHELVALLRNVCADRDKLARMLVEISRAPLCGVLCDDGNRSCQLMRNHDGMHCWMASDGATWTRW